MQSTKNEHEQRRQEENEHKHEQHGQEENEHKWERTSKNGMSRRGPSRMGAVGSRQQGRVRAGGDQE